MKRHIYLYLAFFILSIPVTGWAQSDIPRSFLLAGGTDEPLFFDQDFSTGVSGLPEGVEAETAGRRADALKTYRDVVEHEPERLDVWLRIADIEWARGNASLAAEALEGAVRVSPDDSGLYFRLTRAYAVAKNPVKAFSAIEKAVELAPENIEYLRARAQIANWNGHPEIAVDSYKRILEMSPDDYSALLNKARAELWSGELDEAVSDYKEYLKNHPEKKDVIIEYVSAEAWRGNYPVALETLEEYREKFGETKDYRKSRARVLAWAARPAGAMELIGPLLREDPDDYEVNFSRTVAFHHANRPVETLESLGTVERLRPDSLETRGLRLFVKTPLRSSISLGLRFYSDSDDLRIFHASLEGNYLAKLETRLLAGVETDYLRADTGSGLENINGDEDASHSRAWIGLYHRFSPKLSANINVGGSVAEEKWKIPTYSLDIDLKMRDNLSFSFKRDYGYYVISPRAVSLKIKRGLNRLSLYWEPTLRYTVVALVEYDTLSDDNNRWEGIFAPRRSFLRTEKLNLDLGVRGWWFGFEDDLNHGYYDPELYQSYMVTGFGYWKFNDNNGLSIMGAAGVLKDDTMDDFRFGWSADVEGTFGIYQDWLMKLRGSAIQNERQAGGTFEAYAVQLLLTRRF